MHIKKFKICNTKPIIVLTINNADFKSLKASFFIKNQLHGTSLCDRRLNSGIEGAIT